MGEEQGTAGGDTAMYYSWGSMLRTIRAAVAVMILGGIGLTVPPQTRDMLAFLVVSAHHRVAAREPFVEDTEQPR